MQSVKTTVKEFTYEHSTHYGRKFRNIFYNTHLEFYVFVLYDLIRCRLTNVCYLIFLTHMDDDQTPIRSRFGRGSIGPTRLKCLTWKHVVGEMTHVDIDVNT